MFDRDTSLGFVSNQLARLFAMRLQEAMLDIGLAPAQFMTLVELWREDGLTQKGLVERLDVEQATMANTLSRMERDGLILRKDNPEDRRSRTIWVTDKARALQSAATSAAVSVNARAQGDMGAEDVATTLQAMRAMIAALKA